MRLVTESFIDQVIYHRVRTLVMKGSVYTSLHIQDLIEYKKQMVGERILAEIERAADHAVYAAELKRKEKLLKNALEKLYVLQEMDGGPDAPIGEEAIEILTNMMVEIGAVDG